MISPDPLCRPADRLVVGVAERAINTWYDKVNHAAQNLTQVSYKGFYRGF